MCISTGRDLTQQVLPPRSLFVNHPMGNAFGAPGDIDMQFAVLRAALALFDEAQQGGLLVDAPFEWPKPFRFAPASANMT